MIQASGVVVLIPLIGALVCILLAASACETGNARSVDTADTLAYRMNGDSLFYSLPEIDIDSRTMYRIVYPLFEDKEESVVDTLQREIIEWANMCGADGSAFDDIPSIMRRFIEMYREYRDEESEAALPWTVDAWIGVQQNTADFVALEFNAETYLGGAHGNRAAYFRAFHRPSGRRLNFEEFISPGSYSQIERTAEKIFREMTDIPAKANLEESGYWFKDNRFALNDNFAVTDSGFYFFYNNYEIAAYAVGPTELLIPYESIRKALPQNGYIRRMLTKKK